jgi:hypothetical protein
MDSRLVYGILAVIQHRAASIRSSDALPAITVRNGISLLEQLRSDYVDTPERLTIDCSQLLMLLDLADLMPEGSPIKIILDRVMAGPGEVIRRLVELQTPADVEDLINSLLRRDPAEDLRAILGTIAPFIQRQFGIALSFVTTLQSLGSERLWRALPEAYIQYFFDEYGYVTVDEIPLMPPMHFGGLTSLGSANAALGLDHVKGLLSEKTAERYVRDLIRVTVEAAEDARYDDLRARYAALLTKVGDAKKAKAARWFKGVSSMAEAFVTSAVEEACLGIAEFQTNARIAASAGTYAGTAARKAAQHVFLRELEV